MKRLGWLVPLLILGPIVCAQSSLFDRLYAHSDTVAVEVATDWKQLLQHKADKEYQSVNLRLAGHEFPGRIRTRGHVRLQQCRYPSLKVKLDKSALDSLGFNALNDLKFVIQCSGGDVGLGYVHRERLVYELHALLSPYHHRTVPVRIVMPGESDTLSGFLIETEEQLETRYAASVVKKKQVSTRGLERAAYVNMCLFNYMVLNTDWNVFNLHNVECLQLTETKLQIPIPYDFDYSGLVGTAYATPHEKHDQRSVYEPRWLARHVTAAEFAPVVKTYLAKERAIMDLVANYPMLPKSERRRIKKRLSTFFGQLKDKRSLARLVVD